MAKTASQIQAERKAIDDARNAIHERQMAEIADNKTQTTDPAKKVAMIQEIVSEKSTPKTALDMQKEKEDAAKQKQKYTEEPEVAEALKQQEKPDSQTKAEEAKKKLEEYRNSEEKKKNAEKRLQDKYAQQLLYGITDSSEVLYDEDPREKELQAEADYWDNKVKQEADEKLFAANMQEIQNLSGAERTAFENYANNRTFVDPENLEAYKRLKERYGDKLNDLKYTYQRYKEEKAAREMAEKTAAKMAQGGALADTVRNVLSIGANLVGGITGTAGRINEMVNGTGPYQTAAKYTYGDVPSVYGKTVRDKTSEQILAGQDLNISDGISGRELGAIAYQGGMGALDTGARLLASVGNPFIAASMAASQTFSSTVQEATEKGATPQEAYALATVSAGIEALTEKLPLDNLVSIAKGGANPKLIVNLLLQAGVEIGEEEASLIGTTLAEMAILKEKSGYQQSIQKAAAMGVPYEQAVAEADRALLEEAKQTALISGFSGLLSAGGAEGRNRLLGGSQSQQDSAQQPAAVQQEQTPAQTEQTVQEAPEQPQPIQKLQIAPAAEKPAAPNTIDVLTETITGKPKTAAQTSTQQVDTQTQSAEDGQTEQTQKQTAPQTGDVKMQRARPDDVRPITVPVTDPQGKRVSEVVGNVQGSELTPDSMAKEIEQLVADGNLGFGVRTNRESLENAAAEIKKKGPANVRNRITRSIESRKIKDGDIEQAILLYQKYANGDKDTDLDNAAEMMVDLATMANITGRNLQLFKLLRKMTPEGQLLAVQKEVERNVQSLVSSGKVKKGHEAQIDESLKAEYLNAAKELQKAQKGEDAAKIAEAEQKVKDAQNAIYASEAAKMPATFKAKWDAWRYMAMLGNAKTQVRNVAGNLMFEPYKVVKDKFAALVEKSLPQDQRTKSLMQDPALLNWAREDAKTEDVTNALKYSAKLGDNTAKDQISEKMKVFDNKALESVRKFVAKVPQAGDMMFKNDYYSRSLAGFLKARGYTAEQVKSGQVSNDILNEARTYAINEAMKATFNDSNAFSDAISSIGRGAQDNPWKKALNVAAEGILPFRRTPANIIVRFTEYSPAGIAKGMWDMATHVRNGDMSAATAIDQITAGLTGTGVMMLGYMMAAGMNGIKLTGSGADEDEKRQGHQDYALEFSIGGEEYSYKIDWAAPANLPLFVGANIYNAIKDAGADPDVSKFAAVIRGMGTAFEPMLALSCLSSFNDLVEGIRYAQEGEAVYNMAANIATSYFTQGIPALIRQGYQATQKNKMTTFANDADPTIRDMQKTAANIPFAGAAFQTEKVNAWGETEEQGTVTGKLLEGILGEKSDDVGRIIDAFINPGTAKKIDNSALEQEITRLNNVQTENVTPPMAGKTLSYTDKDGNAHKDVRLTEEQYQTLARTQGQTAKRILDEIIASKDYAAMTDDQKAEAIRQVYSYARKTAEIAAIGDQHTGYEDSWMMEMDTGKEAEYIIRRVIKSGLTGATDALKTAWDRDYDQTGRSDDLKWAYDTFNAMTPEARKDVADQITGTTAKYIEAREMGIGHEEFVRAAETISRWEGTGSNGTVRDIDRRQAIANTRGLTDDQIDTIMKVYMDDYDPENGKTEKTELKYDYIRQKLGLNPKQYAITYRAYLDKSKKDDQIANIMKMGYNKKTATKLWEVYKGRTDVVSWYEKQ